MTFLRKLTSSRVRSRVFRERLVEPLHVNAIAAAVALFGSCRTKIAYDLVLRPHNAFAIDEAVTRLRWAGKRKGTLIEFGVAAGAGLINMARIAQKITAITGTEFRVVGFDTGAGMPQARDYRDHPELYWKGNYPMEPERLRAALPSNAELVLGDLASTVPEFLRRLDPDAPVAYVVLDVDYYSSTESALRLFEAEPACLLPTTRVYVDDINLDGHNSWCGALGAMRAFNEGHPLRKLERDDYLVHHRILKHAAWLAHMWNLHVLDHPVRNDLQPKSTRLTLTNPYL